MAFSILSRIDASAAQGEQREERQERSFQYPLADRCLCCFARWQKSTKPVSLSVSSRGSMPLLPVSRQVWPAWSQTFSILSRIDASAAAKQRNPGFSGVRFQYPLADRCLCCLSLRLTISRNLILSVSSRGSMPLLPKLWDLLVLVDIYLSVSSRGSMPLLLSMIVCPAWSCSDFQYPLADRCLCCLAQSLSWKCG